MSSMLNIAKNQPSKEALKNAYKKAKANYLKNQTPSNWAKFVEAKTNCMLRGIRI